MKAGSKTLPCGEVWSLCEESESKYDATQGYNRVLGSLAVNHRPVIVDEDMNSQECQGRRRGERWQR